MNIKIANKAVKHAQKNALGPLNSSGHLLGRYVNLNMKTLIFVTLVLFMATTASAVTNNCTEIYGLIKHTYAPKQSHIKQIRSKDAQEKNVTAAKLNSLIKPGMERVYCLESNTKNCDKNNSWFAIDIVKLTITKGKEVKCQKNTTNISLNNGKLIKETTFHFYTEK